MVPVGIILSKCSFSLPILELESLSSSLLPIIIATLVLCGPSSYCTHKAGLGHMCILYVKFTYVELGTMYTRYMPGACQACSQLRFALQMVLLSSARMIPEQSEVSSPFCLESPQPQLLVGSLAWRRRKKRKKKNRKSRSKPWTLLLMSPKINKSNERKRKINIINLRCSWSY